MKGCLEWQKSGLNPPPEVIGATEEYRIEMDVIGRFVEECLFKKIGASVSHMNLYQNYQGWCDNTGERAVSSRTFAAKLREKGLKDERGTKGQTKGRYEWLNVSVKKTTQVLLDR